jgi:hypothetical protein
MPRAGDFDEPEAAIICAQVSAPVAADDNRSPAISEIVLSVKLHPGATATYYGGFFG